MSNYPTNLTESQWQYIEKILNDKRKREHSLHDIWNALLYLVKSGCQWRMLPQDFPHWSAVYYYFKKWKNNGVFEEILDHLNEKERKSHHKKELPSVGIIDSQSVKTAHTCAQDIGYDAGKKIKGRKRHIVTDTLGCLLLVLVHGAGVQDRNGIKQVLPVLKYKFRSSIKAIIADNGYSGQPIIDWVKQQLSWSLMIIKRTEESKFKVLPKRWIVERTLAWISYSRRMSRDYEKLTETSQTMTQLAMIRIFIKRI
ncbi:IS5 family transposase [Paludibacter sp. 221]|uniref:IS5 family transposase n=1 Tax=Paludibacter sp. 221 TaxID=2302939 RepID=UPI0013D20F0B|nr:IS5 family transposase [Paludibacter sp. 221]NDV47255.1 IS5 family transposase [Paludibacter sp. 221]